MAISREGLKQNYLIGYVFFVTVQAYKSLSMATEEDKHSTEKTIDYDRVISDQGVYEGRYNGKYAAIKILRGRQTKNEREIAILKKLSQKKYQYVVEYFGFWEQFFPPFTFIAMELCQCDLDKFLEKNSSLHIGARRVVLLHVNLGLKFLHKQKIIHRDLKPQNVVLSRDGQLMKLCDFGLSKAGEGTVSKSKSVFGTDRWMSPEAIMNETTSAKSDMFSFGLLVYYVMMGRIHAFGDELTAMILDDTEQYVPEWPVDSDTTLKLAKALVSKLLLKRHHERLPSSESLLHPFFWNLEGKGTERLQNLIEGPTPSESKILENCASTCKNSIPDLLTSSLRSEDTSDSDTFLSSIQHRLANDSDADRQKTWNSAICEFPEFFLRVYKEGNKIFQTPAFCSKL